MPKFRHNPEFRARIQKVLDKEHKFLSRYFKKAKFDSLVLEAPEFESISFKTSSIQDSSFEDMKKAFKAQKVLYLGATIQSDFLNPGLEISIELEDMKPLPLEKNLRF